MPANQPMRPDTGNVASPTKAFGPCEFLLMYKNVVLSVRIILITILVYFGSVDGGIPYMYALFLESKWHPADPKRMHDLEKHLNLYSVKVIDPSQSGWGKSYKLKVDERMVQYLILWNALLDVVYDKHDNIIRIFTSYE